MSFEVVCVFSYKLRKYLARIVERFLQNGKNFPWKLYGNSRSNCGILDAEEAVWGIGGGISNRFPFSAQSVCR